MKNITATVITLNEEDNIRDCIANLQRVCNEIIVVDSNSSDSTVEIARSMGARVYVQEYLGDGPQKRFGVQYASNDWILSIDADERLDEDMVAAIQALDLEQTEYDAFAFRRKSFIGREWVRVWYPDYLVRLYNKQSAHYEPIKGHAKVVANNVKALDSHIIHYSYKDYSDMVRRIDRFSSRGANILYDKRKKASAASPLLHSIASFLKVFVTKKGFLHGLTGLNVAVISAFSTYVKYAMLVEKYENEKRQGE